MPMTIGEVVKRLREERKLSQYDISRESNGKIKQSWVNSLEHGDIANPPQAKLAALADVLHTTVTDIYDRAGIIDIPSDLPPDEQEAAELIRRMPGPLRRIALKLLRDLNSADSVEDADSQETPRAKNSKTA